MDDETFIDEFRPFRRGELALARKVVEEPLFLLPADLDALRWALRLAQLGGIAERDDLLGPLSDYRLSLLQRLAPILPTDPDRIDATELHQSLPRVRDLATRARQVVLDHGLASPEALDRHVRHKKVAVVMGGAAGSGYVFAGALARLERLGMRPDYLAGCSLGAIIAVLRAREAAFDVNAILERLGELRASGVIRMASAVPDLGLPALLRLDLDAALGGLFRGERGERRALGDLAIATDLLCTGLSAGAAEQAEVLRPLALPSGPRPLDDLTPLRGDLITRTTHRAIALAMSRRLLRPVFLGADPDSARLPALDAAAQSASIPSLIQATPPESDPEARLCLQRVLDRHDSVALVDGGLTSLIPARLAWQQIEAGRLGTRQCAIVALDSIDSAGGANAPLAPFLRVAHASSYRDRPFWDLHLTFERALPLAELLPSRKRLAWAVEQGDLRAGPGLRLLRTLLEPLPTFEECTRAPD